MNRVPVAALVLLGALIGCAAEPHKTAAPQDGTGTSAVERVLAEDERLGSVRNHAPETKPLAEAVEDYVAGLDQLDFAGCPPDFSQAFRRHRDAWANAISFLQTFSDLRGEMHDLFDEIRADEASKAELERLEAEIWGTWSEVEAASAIEPQN